MTQKKSPRNPKTCWVFRCGDKKVVEMTSKGVSIALCEPHLRLVSAFAVNRWNDARKAHEDMT